MTSSYDKWIFIVAMLFGVITSYAYLRFIDRLSLFGDLTDGFSALVAIAVVYCVLAFLIGICFIFSLLVAFLIRDIYDNYQLHIRFLILQFLFLTIGFLPYFLMPFFDLSLHSLWFIFGSVVLIFVLNALIVKSLKNDGGGIDVMFLMLAITTLQHYPIILSVFPIADFSNKNFDEWMLFLLIPSINLLMYLISFLAIAVSPDKNFNIKNIFFVMFGIFFAIYFALFSIKGQVPYQSLYAVRFIEKPKNSSWYIIHNGNTTSDKINGFDTKQINIFKKDFSKPYQCTGIEGDILYGYMAWNLGNTKVFCPQSVNFFKTDNQNERNVMSQKCLVIDGKYLQLISDYYIEH